MLYVSGADDQRTVLGHSPAFMVRGPAVEARTSGGFDSGSPGGPFDEDDDGSASFFLEPVVAHIITSPARSSYDRICLCRDGERPGHASTDKCSKWVPQPAGGDPFNDPHVVDVPFEDSIAPRFPGKYVSSG